MRIGETAFKNGFVIPQSCKRCAKDPSKTHRRSRNKGKGNRTRKTSEDSDFPTSAFWDSQEDYFLTCLNTPKGPNLDDCALRRFEIKKLSLPLSVGRGSLAVKEKFFGVGGKNLGGGDPKIGTSPGRLCSLLHTS